MVDLLLRSGIGRQVRSHLAGHVLWTVAHLDAEVFSALSRLHRDARLDADQVRARLGILGRLELERLPITPGLLDAAWDLRHNVVARDALYVAAAQTLDAELVTTDLKVARVVPHVAATWTCRSP